MNYVRLIGTVVLVRHLGRGMDWPDMVLVS